MSSYFSSRLARRSLLIGRQYLRRVQGVPFALFFIATYSHFLTRIARTRREAPTLALVERDLSGQIPYSSRNRSCARFACRARFGWRADRRRRRRRCADCGNAARNRWIAARDVSQGRPRRMASSRTRFPAPSGISVVIREDRHDPPDHPHRVEVELQLMGRPGFPFQGSLQGEGTIPRGRLAP